MRVVFVFKNMTEVLKIPRSVIDPEDLRDDTVGFERPEQPGRIFIARLQEPLVYLGERKVSIIREPLNGDGYIIDWDVILMGGEDKGLRFEGISEELRLRYSPQVRLSEAAITADDNRRYWGS